MKGRRCDGTFDALAPDMLDSLNAKTLIKENMPVVGSDDSQLAIVDHVEGTDAIKLARDSDGRHHYIPLTWVSSVDDKVHLDRTSDQATQEWSPTPVITTDRTDDVPAPRYVNSVDATVGQPIVSRILTRKHELEAALEALPGDDIRGRGDLELALSTIEELLTGDLHQVPATVVADMNRWLERNKHLAERASVSPSEAVTVRDADAEIETGSGRDAGTEPTAVRNAGDDADIAPRPPGGVRSDALSRR